MKTVTTLLAAALLLAAAAAQATTIGLHLGSHHSPARDRNNFNPGVYVVTDSGWTAGAYYNSFRRATLYAGHTWSWDLVGDLSAGAMVAVASGYRTRRNHSGIALVVVPSLAYGSDSARLRLSYIPRSTPKSSQVLHLSVERMF